MFLSLFRADSSDRSPWGDWWFEPVASGSLSGASVTPDTALQLSAVWRAVSLISGHFAMLPLLLKKSDSLKRIKGHSLQKLFKKPNPYQNGFEWREMLAGHLLLRGNCYNEIIDNARGEITALMPLHPDRIKIELLPSGDYRYRYTDANGVERILTRGQVWHIRGLSSNGITGIGVIQCARESMGMSLAAQNYGARFFANDAKPTGGWIEFPGNFADKNARDVFRESVQQAQGDKNRGKMMVLDKGMKYHEVGLTNVDAQFLESRKFGTSEIARWFGIPPHKLADLDRSTNNNIEQQALEYINDGLLIFTERWEASIETELLFDDDGIDVEFDFAKLLRGDSGTRYTNYGKGIIAGWLTRNEARADDGREPLDGLDEPLRPLNMVEERDAEDLEENPAAPTPPGGDEAVEDAPPAPPKKKKPADETAARFEALLHANATRMARRILKAGSADACILSEALAIPLERAEAWGKNTLWTAESLVEQNLIASLVELGRNL